jgi:hypothetical protein
MPERMGLWRRALGGEHYFLREVVLFFGFFFLRQVLSLRTKAQSFGL